MFADLYGDVEEEGLDGATVELAQFYVGAAVANGEIGGIDVADLAAEFDSLLEDLAD